MIRLSKRLDLILSLIPDGSCVADVGTDHGWLIIKAILIGKTKKAYGLDIADGPLNQARNNAEKYGVLDAISLLKMDGLSEFTYTCDTFVIAGMGAETIWSIISNYSFKLSDRIIVQSNTHIPWLRKVLSENHFNIIDEKFVIDNKKPVFILVCHVGEQTLDLTDQYIGPVLRKSRGNQAYLMYLNTRYQHLRAVSVLNEKYLEEFTILKNFIETE